MLNKIQKLLESDSISPELKLVLEKAREQEIFLSFIESPKDSPILNRYVREYESFFTECNIQQEYPLSKYTTLREVSDIHKENEEYSCSLIMEFTWPRCYDTESAYIHFKSSWLLANDLESPWLSSWVNDKINFCCRELAVDRIKLANILGITDSLLTECSKGNINDKINRLHNLNLCCNVLRKKNIRNLYEYLINSRIVFDKEDNEDGDCSFLNIIVSDTLLTKEEIETYYNQIEHNNKTNQEYQAFLELQKKYGELK